jgi:hypothetical protein
VKFQDSVCKKLIHMKSEVYFIFLQNNHLTAKHLLYLFYKLHKTIILGVQRYRIYFNSYIFGVILSVAKSFFEGNFRFRE